jgi:hypothetical protein
VFGERSDFVRDVSVDGVSLMSELDDSKLMSKKTVFLDFYEALSKMDHYYTVEGSLVITTIRRCNFIISV